MKKLLLLEEELAASGNCEHWVKLEFSDGDYMVDVSATERISNADGEVQSIVRFLLAPKGQF